MIKDNIKKAFTVLFTLIICMNTIIPAEVMAATYVTGSVPHANWWLADPDTGRRNEPEDELTVNGETVFCIDAYTRFKSGVSMNSVPWSTVGISNELAKELSLIAYFGTKVEGRTSKDWYAITQGLIWKTIHSNDSNMCYVETPTNPNYAATVSRWNEILADVAEYKKIPSFADGTYEVDANKTVTLTDTNSALRNMNIVSTGGLDVSINGSNQLIIKGKPTADDTATIVLQRNVRNADTGTSLVFHNGKDQSLALFKISDPLTIRLRVKVNKFGELELTKWNDDESATVKDASFRITGANGYNQTFTTNEEGKIHITELPIGEYKAVETQAGMGILSIRMNLALV